MAEAAMRAWGRATPAAALEAGAREGCRGQGGCGRALAKNYF